MISLRWLRLLPRNFLLGGNGLVQRQGLKSQLFLRRIVCRRGRLKRGSL